jgi:hypothetical protein
MRMIAIGVSGGSDGHALRAIRGAGLLRMPVHSTQEEKHFQSNSRAARI